MNRKIKTMLVGILMASSLLAGCVDSQRLEEERNKMAKLSFSLGYHKAHLDARKFYIKNNRLPELEDMDVDKAWCEVKKILGESK